MKRLILEYHPELKELLCNKHDKNKEDKRILFQLAFDHGLIDDSKVWAGYNSFRNDTSHEYNLEKAENVFKIIDDFLIDVKQLLANMKECIEENESDSGI